MNKDACGTCRKTETEDTGGELWVECVNPECMQWFHNRCVGLPEVPVLDTATWYCDRCKIVSVDNGSDNNSGEKEDEAISQDEDDQMKLQCMANLIKEKEELCVLKQKQLDMMERMSQKKNSMKVKSWLKETQPTAGQSSGQVVQMASRSEDVRESHLQKMSILNKRKISTNKNLGSRDSQAGRVDEKDELSVLLKRQMQLMNQHYLTELPEFDGDPDIWPIFYQQFLTTSEQGGFDDAFNLIRLRKSLKGEARQVVSGIISLPNCLPEVIGILEKRFGNQNNIVKRKVKALSNLQPLNENKPHTMKQFFEFLIGFNATLKSVGAFDYLESPYTMDTIAEKLPLNLRRKWLGHMRDLNRRATITEFLTWFEPFYDCVSEFGPESSKIEATKRNSSRVNVNNEHANESSSKSSGLAKYCKFCRKSQHDTQDCDKFKKLSTGKRWLFVRQRKLCFSCLQTSHRYDNCEKKRSCNIEGCQEFHHRLLHRKMEIRSSVTPLKDAEDYAPEVVLSTKSSISTLDSNQTLFRSLPVVLHNPANGKKVEVWAFLDEGSSPTMLLESVARELMLNGERDELCTTWTDDTVRKEKNSRRVQLKISGVGQSRMFTMKNVRTVSTMSLPIAIARQKIIEKHDHLRDLKMPDIPVDRPVILIGLEHVKMGLMYEIREGQWNEPVATRTRLGWAIHGKQENNSTNYVCHVCDCGNRDELENLIREFSSTESFGVKVVDQLLEAKDTIRANKILELTTKKLNDNYETGLLWRRENIKLPESRSMAAKRLICFEKRLDRDKELKQQVQCKMREHIEKGYLHEIIPETIRERRHWYLPVFAVHNPNKPLKPRLVFDAAAQSNGVCLNDMLLKGPEKVSSLFGIILRFRLRQFAVSADIAEMYHRVSIIEDDQLCQLILWRDGNVQVPMRTYKMTRMTFGATCSPCSAHYVKDVNAKLFSNLYPRAVESIICNHYVDNLLDCYDTEEEAVNIAQQIRLIHKSAGFNIRDWVSNSRAVMEEMNRQSGSNENMDVNLNVLNEATTTERILGMYWKIAEDMFVFKVNVSKIDPYLIQKKRPPSKREVLKVVMSQFDPLGILSPMIVHAKILMQEIWLSGVDWDERISPILQKKWENWLAALQLVCELRVPRWYFKLSRLTETKKALHIFADASEEAFASVAFIVQYNKVEIDVSFLAAKSRVAPGPPKSLSIPRLELQAAVLAIRLLSSIIGEISVKFDNIFLWTDSKTVLGWIRSTKRKYSAFVSHRVTEILESSTVNQWRWLPGKQNVADEATRISESPEISHRWLNGPEFLYRGMEYWPQENERIETTEEETKFEPVCHVQQNYEIFDLNRFSRWERLLRCIAYVHRFIESLRGSKWQKTLRVVGKESVSDLIKSLPPLSSNEIGKAEKTLFKMVQHDSYATEIKALAKGESISRKSNIFNLTPVLDEEGLLRLAGRLDAAPSIIVRDVRRPIILNREHPITYLLIDAVHRKFHHVNKESVVNEIRQFLWIPKIRVQVNRVIRECNYCKYRLAKPRIPKMGPLPLARLSPYQAPFSYTGIDFFGPVEITVGRHHEKRWGVLFVCLTMRAIHLELSSTLNTNSAIMSIRNFICRRGSPIELFSDNGTNLKAAEKELKDAVQAIDHVRLQNETITSLPNEVRPKWTFIPPSAPHFGGSWERMIQIVKKSLYIILKHKYPKEETLRNALIEIENLVNSRPLYYAPNDVDNSEAITPNHLLRGSNRQMAPFPGEFDCRKQWRIAQAIADEFWKKWLREYLPTISRRPKWQSEADAVAIGELVLIIDENLQRGEWKKGVISKVYPSKDGKIRSVEVRTAQGCYVRPVAKLAIIDIHCNEKY